MRPLVLVHGWGFGSTVWQPLVERLPAGKVHLIDLPGYGPNTAPPERFPDGAVVCGWSLGALHVLRWATRHPGKIARLVLVGATPRFLQAQDWPCAQPATLLDGFATAVDTSPVDALRRFAVLSNQGDAHARALAREMTAIASRTLPTADALRAGLADLRETDLRTTVPGLRQPALVIHGEHDPLMPLAAGQWLATHLANARLAVIASAAHAPFLSDPAGCAARIAEFAHE